MSHGIWKQQGNSYDVTNSEAGWQATNPASCKHDPGLKEVPEPSSKHSISAVAHSGEVAATSGGTGRNYQGEFDSLTARSARSDSCGSAPSALRFISPNHLPSRMRLNCDWKISFIELLWRPDPPNGSPKRSARILKTRGLVSAVRHGFARLERKCFGVSSGSLVGLHQAGAVPAHASLVHFPLSTRAFAKSHCSGGNVAPDLPLSVWPHHPDPL